MTRDRQARVGPLSEWVATPADDLITESIPQVLARQAASRGEQPAVWWSEADGVASLSYGELAEAATRVARALAGRASAGDRVAVWAANCLEWVVLEQATAMAGMVLTPLNTAWVDAELEHALRLTTPSLVFAGSVRRQRLVDRARRLASSIEVVDLAELHAWAAGGKMGELPFVGSDDPFLIQFTSGTTGRAKGALLSHRAALNSAHQLLGRDVVWEPDVYLNPLPFHHVGGSVTVQLGALVNGGAFVLMDRWDPDHVIRMIEHGVVTRMGGVPTMMVDLLDRMGPRTTSCQFASIAMGGAEVPEALIRRVQVLFGAPVIVIYGQSESPAITTTLLDDDAATIATTVGVPLPSVDLKLVNPDDGGVVPLGTAGEVLVRSPYTMDGYWGSTADHADGVFTADGFLRTGDLAIMDATGHLTFQGRAREVIIRGGENIYPAEIEAALAAHPGVATAAIVGLDDDRLGEQVAGVVVRAPGCQVAGEELAAFLADHVAWFKVPVAWRFVDQLPMTASGKVRRVVVREETNAELNPSAPSTTTGAT